MPLVPLPELLADARARGYAVGYFEAWDGWSLEAVLEAAEAERAPIVLGFGCSMTDRGWLEAGGIERLGALGRTAAGRAGVPAALLLNETTTEEQALRGIEAGFNAVMLETESLRATARLVGAAHPRGVAVEGAVGVVPLAGVAPVLTDPEEAAAYAAATHVDCLAVSIGNVHLLRDGVAKIDLDRLEAVHRAVPLPLAVHGGTGFPADAVEAAIERGVAKFNVGTALKECFLAGVRQALEALEPDPDVHSVIGSRRPGDVLLAGKERVQAVVRELIARYGSSGRA